VTVGLTRRIPRKALSIALISVGLLAAACGSTSVSSAKSLPSAPVLAALKASLGKQTSVHFVVTAKQAVSSSIESVVGDFGIASGEERVTQGKATLAVKLTPSDAYLAGSSLGLTQLVGLTTKEAAKVGARWLLISSSSSPYSSLKDSVTVGGIAGQLPAAKSTKAISNVVNGSREDVLEWSSPATKSSPKLTSSLTIANSLPVRETSKSSAGSVTEGFSRWGEAVHVTAPPSSETIPYTAVTG